MPLHQLLSMIPHEVMEINRPVVARWTDTPETGLEEAEPAYGAFVDDQGRVVPGTRPARAFLETDDPRFLLLAPEIERSLRSGSVVVFLDWGRQNLSWEEIFDLWEAWTSQGMVVDCGAVSVKWSASSHWVAPSWVAFADGFDGSPLSTMIRVVAQTERPKVEASSAPVPSTSFLARALKIRGEGDSSNETLDEGDGLPMIPFTLTSLKDPHFAWPKGVA